MNPYCAATLQHRDRLGRAMASIQHVFPLPNKASDAASFAATARKSCEHDATHGGKTPPGWLVENWQANELRDAIQWIDAQRNQFISDKVLGKLLEARNALTAALSIHMCGYEQPSPAIEHKKSQGRGGAQTVKPAFARTR